jgi:ribosomal protein S18 acetylase RimI-like enzyme
LPRWHLSNVPTATGFQEWRSTSLFTMSFDTAIVINGLVRPARQRLSHTDGHITCLIVDNDTSRRLVGKRLLLHRNVSVQNAGAGSALLM